MAAGAGESEDDRYRVKPMNCPMHTLIYKSQQRSYRDLPIRLAEFANVYRNEKSGTLHGLPGSAASRMDDAHIFCTMEQVEDEIFLCLDQVDRLVRQTFGFELDFEISTRPEERLGTDEIWDRAEADAAARAGADRASPSRIDAGGGAFYGPRSTSSSGTRSAGCGRGPRSSSTSTFRSASSWNTPGRTTSRTGRS